MAMTIEQWNELTRSIVAAGADQGQVTALLTQATNEYAGLLSEAEESKKKVDQLTEDNGNLQRYNMDLFLQLGDQKRAQDSKENEKKEESKERAESITFDDLFKEEK